MAEDTRRRERVRHWILTAAAALLAAGAIVGCQKMPADQRLQRFVTTYQGLAPEQRQTALTAVVFSGEKDHAGSIRDDRVKRLARDYQELPAAQKEAALRAVLASGEGGRALAEYGLGNVFYASAGDSAEAGKSAEPATIALLDSARVHFESAVAVDSTLVEAYVNLGSVDDDLSTHTTARDRIRTQLDQQSAEKAYQRAIALRPSDEKARCNLGALYVRLHRDTSALEQFKTVLAQNDKSALAHYNLAIMFADTKMYREALREWQSAADDDPHGDIGKRSQQNVKIFEQMMATPVPKDLGESPPAAKGQGATAPAPVRGQAPPAPATPAPAPAPPAPPAPADTSSAPGR